MASLLGRMLLAGCLVGGFMLTSCGVLRESFSDLAREAGWGEARWDEEPWGGGLRPWQESVVRVGVAVGLLPTTRELDISDRRRNAAYAMVGTILLAICTVAEVVRQLRGG